MLQVSVQLLGVRVVDGHVSIVMRASSYSQQVDIVMTRMTRRSSHPHVRHLCISPYDASSTRPPVGVPLRVHCVNITLIMHSPTLCLTTN